MKLSIRQKQVIDCLKDGGRLITSDEMCGAIVAKKDGTDFYIGNRVFWNLVEKGLIIQENALPFNYVITELGLQQ